VTPVWSCSQLLIVGPQHQHEHHQADRQQRHQDHQQRHDPLAHEAARLGQLVGGVQRPHHGLHAPLSDHSANTAPTAIMTSLLSDASSCVMLARTSSSTLSGTSR
jgi:hypothetical protein